MTASFSNTLTTVAALVVAFCAFAALCLNFWNSLKPVDQKLAILLFLVELSEVAAFALTGYFVIFTDRIVGLKSD